MSTNYEKVILNTLLDKYEKSKSFTGDNKVNQKFTLRTSTLFPAYMDHSNFELFQSVNEAIDILTRNELIIAKLTSANRYETITLNLNNLEKVYPYINRVPKHHINQAVLTLLHHFKDKNEILHLYFQDQNERIETNKPIKFFNNDLEELKNILIAVDELLKVESETFLRDFSVKIFKDSKRFQSISDKVVNLIYEYGNFPNKDNILGELNIIKNPTYVNFKGNATLTIKDQEINLSGFSSDIAISSSMLQDITQIHITSKAVITIENLTSFHTFPATDLFAIYLGGYHNSIRREFIKKIYTQNPSITFHHFGDIDAGGFYIMEHLKHQTGIDFQPYKMDINTLKQYSSYTKKLTSNDRKRLLKLKDSPYREVIHYMLENNCKLEQEAIQ